MCVALSPVRAAELTTFAAAEKEAERLQGTEDGYAYMVKFLDAIAPAVGRAMHACQPKTPKQERDIHVAIVFIVGADGRMERILHSPNSPSAICFMKNFRLPAPLPRPPHGHWPVNSVLAIDGAPQDRNATAPMPFPKYEHIIAPYVAKARATYPAAKKRFFAGLPRGWRFEVWLRLYQNDQSGKHVAAEDCFVAIERIQEGRVWGILMNQPIIVHGYTRGDRVTAPEAEVRNWMFARPDGTEEGNVVGKFLEKHYKLQ